MNLFLSLFVTANLMVFFFRKKISLIFLSYHNKSRLSSEAKARKIGFSGFVFKPLEVDVVIFALSLISVINIFLVIILSVFLKVWL